MPDPGADAPGQVRPPLRGSWNRLSVELVVPPSSRIPTSARLNPNVQRPSIAEVRSGKNGTGRRRFSSEGSSLFQVERRPLGWLTGKSRAPVPIGGRSRLRQRIGPGSSVGWGSVPRPFRPGPPPTVCDPNVSRSNPGRCNAGDDKERAAGMRCRDGAATVTKIDSRSVSGFRLRF